MSLVTTFSASATGSGTVAVVRVRTAVDPTHHDCSHCGSWSSCQVGPGCANKKCKQKACLRVLEGWEGAHERCEQRVTGILRPRQRTKRCGCGTRGAPDALVNQCLPRAFRPLEFSGVAHAAAALPYLFPCAGITLHALLALFLPPTCGSTPTPAPPTSSSSALLCAAPCGCCWRCFTPRQLFCSCGGGL